MVDGVFVSGLRNGNAIEMTPHQLNSWLQHHNLSKRQAAKLLGVSYNSVWNWTQGGAKIPKYMDNLTSWYDQLLIKRLNDENDRAYQKMVAQENLDMAVKFGFAKRDKHNI